MSINEHIFFVSHMKTISVLRVLITLSAWILESQRIYASSFSMTFSWTCSYHLLLTTNCYYYYYYYYYCRCCYYYNSNNYYYSLTRQTITSVFLLTTSYETVSEFNIFVIWGGQDRNELEADPNSCTSSWINVQNLLGMKEYFSLLGRLSIYVLLNYKEFIVQARAKDNYNLLLFNLAAWKISIATRNFQLL